MKDIIEREEITKYNRIYNINTILNTHNEYKSVVTDKNLQFYKINNIENDENIQVYSEIFKKCVIEINPIVGYFYIDRKFINSFNDIDEHEIYVIMRNILNYINCRYTLIVVINKITIENDTHDYMNDDSFTLIDLK